jgi:hypothetical protein
MPGNLCNLGILHGRFLLCWPVPQLCALRRPRHCEAHTNFADESACLTADNVRNEVATIHRSQEVLKVLSLYT